MDSTAPVWVEDESRVIGTVHVPEELFQTMIGAPLWEVQRTSEERVDELCRIYGEADCEALKAAFMRIREKLGAVACQQAISALDKNDLRTAAGIGLGYYDNLYGHTLTRSLRDHRVAFSGKGKTFDQIARELIASSTP